MPIDKTAWKDDWAAGAKAKVDKLIRKYKAKTGKIAAATSDEAQKSYIAGVTDPLNQRKRLKHLKELSDADLDAAMDAKTPTAYPAGVDAAKDKALRHVDPYLSEIDSIVPKLKAPTRDARTNVMERVIPLAVGLQNKKKALLK